MEIREIGKSENERIRKFGLEWELPEPSFSRRKIFSEGRVLIEVCKRWPESFDIDKKIIIINTTPSFVSLARDKFHPIKKITKFV